MADELQTWFRQMPYRLRRELAGRIKDIAENLADEIKAAAPVGETGHLRDSIRVRRGRKTLEFVVEAGGTDTTKDIRSGAGVEYDYARAIEFGTTKMPAHPFFYTTARARAADVRADIEQAVSEVLEKA